MADFNSSFIKHLKHGEENRTLRKAMRKKAVVYPGQKLVRKYKRNIWCNKPHRKKIKIILKKSLINNDDKQIKYSWEGDSRFIVSEGNSYNSAVLPNISHCKDFPITDIGSELSGNRNNGNSPFSSSNSCGSPPDSQILCKTEKTIAAVSSDCQKCNMENSEQNNNTHVECTCSEENVYCDVEMKECSSADTNSEQSEVCTDSDKDDIQSLDIDGGISGDTYIDVESLDESGEDRETVTEVISDKVVEVCENGLVDEPVQYVGSNVKHSQPSTQINPIKWQQQFMSFLSSSTSDESKKHHHSPRRKRSRKIRQSSCPCCLSSGEHHKKKENSDDLVRHRKSHSLQRDHRRFIRDMTQLVSLRNKVMSVCKVLFPQCIDNVFNYANPDSEDVDKCIDQMISILHNTHQQFLHNLNVKSELNRSTYGPKCFKSERKGNLKYDHLNSHEVLVSFCDQSETVETYKEQTPTCDKIAADEISHDPPVLFCQESVDVKNSAIHEQPSLFSNLCLDGNGNGVVYAIPVKNGIAYPDQTQVLLTGDNSPDIGFVDKGLFPSESEHEGNNDKNHLRILSEADSGIINDHEISSPNDDDISPLSDDQKVRSKTEQTTNIFDLFSQCEPQITKMESVNNSSQEKPEIKSIKTGDRNIFESPDVNSSMETGDINILDSPDVKSPVKTGDRNIFDSPDIKSPIKTGDRNIFESLFSMNIEASPPKCVQKEFDNICDKEIESFYLPSEKHKTEDKTEDIYVEVYDPSIRLCKKPKICLRAFKEKISQLLRWLLPEIAFEKNFFKNKDNLEYMLDALILSNKNEPC